MLALLALDFLLIWYNVRGGNEPCEDGERRNGCLQTDSPDDGFIGRMPVTE